jgi:hypothetical protein
MGLNSSFTPRNVKDITVNLVDNFAAMAVVKSSMADRAIAKASARRP